MITCKRCGRPAPMGLANCQYCGMPLTNTAADETGSSMPPNMIPGMAPRMGAPEQPQPELPAWLETLRSSERPGTSSGGGTDFSAGGLIDEGMLPGWMRPERPDMADNNPSGKYPAYPGRRSSSMPAPNTDSAFLPTGGMSASSLIDEQSLPSWLYEKQGVSQSEAGPQKNIAASSLVQPEALPQWMKNVQPQSPTPTTPDPMYYAQPGIPPQGIMGNDLVDQQALPQWMSGQNTPASTGGQAGLAGSSLLDEHALPSWMREANQEQQRGNAFPSPAPTAQTPMNQLPNNQPLYNQPPYTQAPANGNLSAASFIDVSALPDWLRPAEDQRQMGAYMPQQQGFVDNAGQTTFGASSRADNMRVPSRPRGEIVPREESEVAASVFASVLGVASAAPNFPGQRDAYGRPQMPPQSQQNIPQQPLGGAIPGTFNAPGMPQGYPGMPPIQGNMQAPGAYPVGSMPPGPGMPPQQLLPPNVAGMQPGTYMNNGNAMPKPNEKPARRGFLSTILDWFSR